MNESQVFTDALKLATPAERAAYLDQACAGNPQLRAAVQALLQAHASDPGFLDQPVGSLDGTIDLPPDAERPGSMIGPYKLLQQIGEGGMGTVYLAEQTHPVRRKVALKVIKAGMDSRQVIARFEAERQALALMDHINIARVLDAGATRSGRPYFVMELVLGVPITKYCDDNQLTPRERLELFVPVCQAIQHAHQKGIIHRDIKPSNVMITLYDGQPVPKVIDFGVAKATELRLTERTLFTQYGTMVGTFEYMSPEQAEMSALGVDTRSDNFSLGVLLYELLTGSTPLSHKRLKEAAYGEILRMIREEEAPKPSIRLSDSGAALASISAQRHMEPAKLTKLVRGELDWIVMKSLEKDRNRRYETASAFAADVQRYLDDEPVEACPQSAWYRFRKFARRNQVAITTAVLLSTALMLGTTVSIWQAIRATRAEQLAQARLQTETTARTAEAEQRRIANDQRRIADDERREAERQRQQAEINFAKTRQAVDDYFNTVSESRLLDVPGLEPLRKELLESALKYYGSFAEQKGDDPGRQADLAAAHLRVAQIMYWNGDRPDRFFPHRRKAIEILERLVREGLDTPEVQRRVAGFFRANPDARSYEPGDTMKPGVMLLCTERFPPIWEKFVRDNPDVVDFQNDLAGIYVYLALDQYQSGKTAETLRSVGRAIAIWEKLAKEHPREPRYRLNLALVYEGVGRVYLFAGRRDQARKQFLKALPLREQLVSEFPHVAGYRAWLGITYQYLGEGAASPDEAEQAYAKAVDQFEKVAAEFPTMRSSRKDLAMAYLQLADAMTSRGKPAEALKLYRRSVNLFEALVAESPDYWRDPVLLSDALYKLSRRLKDTGQGQEADEVYRKARESLPHDAGKLNNLAWMFATSRDVEFRDAGWAVELARKGIELAPKSGIYWNTLGVAQYRAGDWQAAIAALGKSMELRKGGDSFDWFFLALAHHQLGHKDEARKRYDQAVQWMDKNQPKNEELRRFRTEAAELLGVKEEKRD